MATMSSSLSVPAWTLCALDAFTVSRRGEFVQEGTANEDADACVDRHLEYGVHAVCVNVFGQRKICDLFTRIESGQVSCVVHRTAGTDVSTLSCR